jgi:hypothetical protein
MGVYSVRECRSRGRVQLKCDDTRWRMGGEVEWVASTLHTTSEHGVSSITTADAHNSAAGSRLNWRPRRFKWTRPFRRKTKSGFCARAITFQTQSNTWERDLKMAAVNINDRYLQFSRYYGLDLHQTKFIRRMFREFCTSCCPWWVICVKHRYRLD